MSTFFPQGKAVIALDETSPSSIKSILEGYGYSFSPSYERGEMNKDWVRLKEKIVLNSSFNQENVSAVILSFEERNDRANEERISSYLLNKGISIFTSVNQESKLIENGALPYQKEDDLKMKMMMAKAHHYLGIEARSLILSSDSKAVSEALKPLFSFARLAKKFQLIPILEIEVDMRIPDKDKAEKKVMKELVRFAKRRKEENQIIYRLSFPEENDLYAPLLSFDSTFALLSLETDLDNQAILSKMKLNPSLTPAFSQLLLSKLNAKMDDSEFSNVLSSSLKEIKQESENSH